MGQLRFGSLQKLWRSSNVLVKPLGAAHSRASHGQRIPRRPFAFISNLGCPSSSLVQGWPRLQRKGDFLIYSGPLRHNCACGKDHQILRGITSSGSFATQDLPLFPVGFWSTVLEATSGHGRLWPNRLWPALLADRLWPKPTLAKPTLTCVVCCVLYVCVFVCLCVFVWCVAWVLVSRFHGVGFHVWVLVWSCSVRTALPRPPFPGPPFPGPPFPRPPPFGPPPFGPQPLWAPTLRPPTLSGSMGPHPLHPPTTTQHTQKNLNN